MYIWPRASQLFLYRLLLSSEFRQNPLAERYTTGQKFAERWIKEGKKTFEVVIL